MCKKENLETYCSAINSCCKIVKEFNFFAPQKERLSLTKEEPKTNPLDIICPKQFHLETQIICVLILRTSSVSNAI